MWKPVPMENNEWGVALSDGFLFKDYNDEVLTFIREEDAQGFCDTRNAIDAIDIHANDNDDFWERRKKASEIMEQTNNYYVDLDGILW